MYNEQGLNGGDSWKGYKYDPSEDKGSYIIGYDYGFNGMMKEGGSYDSLGRAMEKTLQVGLDVITCVPVLGELVNLGTSIADVVGMMRSYAEVEISGKFNEETKRLTGRSLHKNKVDQIAKYGGLTKLAYMLVESEGKEGVWYKAGAGQSVCDITEDDKTPNYTMPKTWHTYQ